MLEEALLFWSWLQGGAIEYLCGDAPRMAKDAHAALISSRNAGRHVGVRCRGIRGRFEGSSSLSSRCVLTVRKQNETAHQRKLVALPCITLGPGASNAVGTNRGDDSIRSA